VTLTVVSGVISPSDVHLAAGRWTVLELVNRDAVVRDWMAQGIANVELVARPGQTVTLRVVIDSAGTYDVMTGTTDGPGTMAGSLVVDPR
jgi:heme/copper-type cytochrome/quinol oxidase subunit 2